MTEAGPLLLVESSRGSRISLQHALSARGFDVTAVPSIADARAAATAADFAFAVVNLRQRDGDSLAFVQRLRERSQAMRIVVVTDADSFASVISALGAGARHAAGSQPHLLGARHARL